MMRTRRLGKLTVLPIHCIKRVEISTYRSKNPLISLLKTTLLETKSLYEM